MSILNQTVTVAQLTISQEIEVVASCTFAGHYRSIRVPAGTYEVKTLTDFRGPSVFIEWHGTVVHDTWNGAKHGGSQAGSALTVRENIFAYCVPHTISHGEDLCGFFRSGQLALVAGWSVDPVNPNAMVAPTGEVIAAGVFRRPGEEVASYRAWCELL